jgi:hypothetical protein
MRTENKNMISFLKQNGINTKVKVRYLWEGSMAGCWQIHSPGQSWTAELCEKFTALGFKDFDFTPLGKFSGNGGMFSVSVRGHNELLPH